MRPRVRSYTHVVASAGLLLAIALGWLGGCSSAPAITEAIATLYASVQVSALEGTTRIVAVSLTPKAPASVTLASGAVVSVTEPDASTGASATPTAGFGGVTCSEPLDLNSFGTAAVRIGSTSGSGLTIEDGYGHTLNIGYLQVKFQHTARGETNLPETSQLVLPLRGARRALADLLIGGAAPGQKAKLSVALSGGTTLTQEATADDGGVLRFVTTDAETVSDLSSATIEYPAAVAAGAR